MTEAFTCPFCNDEGALLANEHALVRRDANPVTPGHLLVTTRRHVADFFETRDDERQALLALLERAKEWLVNEQHPDGFNVGINVGAAAGQTVPHVHIHLIPRRLGDTPHPRGGVRGVIPDKRSY
jgi:diadenosine tetraphosphate (Ap4A) HIT family hydrolase